MHSCKGTKEPKLTIGRKMEIMTPLLIGTIVIQKQWKELHLIEQPAAQQFFDVTDYLEE